MAARKKNRKKNPPAVRQKRRAAKQARRRSRPRPEPGIYVEPFDPFESAEPVDEAAPDPFDE